MKYKYGSLVIMLHWGMLLLIIAVYTSIELRKLYPKDSGIRGEMEDFHFVLGICVLVLVFVRLIVRMIDVPAPKIVPAPNRWMQFMSSAMHIVLYMFMIALPIAGLIGANKNFARSITEIHEFGANLGLALIGMHVATALFHHYVLRDNTLRRILPMINS
jgi:superoxide oxidase